MPRVMLVQPGARHNYALARFLHDQGMLQRLYTDFAIGTDDPLASLLKLPLPSGLRGKITRRLTDAVPGAKILSGLDISLPGLGRRTLRSPTSRDIADSDGFYLQYFTGGTDIRRRARRKPIISDVFIVPSAYRETDREVRAFPDWGQRLTSPDLAFHNDMHSRAMIEQSDILFCPSQGVIDDIAQHYPRHTAKCRLVPYGASVRNVSTVAVQPGRVLFCGSLHLRKGVQYISAAAAALRESHPRIRFVFAGEVSKVMRDKLTAPNIDLLGHLAKADIIRELGRADIFLFPSLAEGSAGAVLEAMASGLPIVATRTSGVDFIDGVSGIVIPPRDADAIAAAVVRIVEDRSLRAVMAAGAAREAERYSMAAWEARFIAAIRDVF